METLAGTAACAAGTVRASPACAPQTAELSQNFLTVLFYFLSESSPTCDNADDQEFPMRTIRQILQTEYIGAIVVAVLIADACSALFTAAVEQISYHFYFAENNMPRAGRLSITYSVLATLTRVALYLISAYLLARWLYPAKTGIAGHGTESQEGQKLEGIM